MYFKKKRDSPWVLEYRQGIKDATSYDQVWGWGEHTLKGMVMWRGGLSSASLGKKYPSLSLLSPRESSQEAKHSYASFPKPHFCLHKETGELTKGKGLDKQVQIRSQSTSSSFQIALTWGEPEDDAHPGQGPRALSVSKLNV